MNQSIGRLNEMSTPDATAEFLKCCGATAWAREMAAARPFTDAEALFGEAEALFDRFSEDDWLEAFLAHPKIGEQKAAGAQSETAQNWSAEEQSQTQSAATGVMEKLAEANREYEQRFGFIFIVCATGKTADQMLSMLRQRLENPPAAELRIAAKEQKSITQLRLQKLLESLPGL